MNTILQGDCLERLQELEDNSIDLVCTDPPYGIGFMGKEWDTFKPDSLLAGIERSSRKSTAKNHENLSVREKGSAAMESARYDHSNQGAKKFREWFTPISSEMLRVLKPGAFAFVCIGARQDSVSAVITAMTEAGFKTDFTSLFWTYASGFPKAMNIGKMVDKRNGRDQDTYKPFADYLKECRKAIGLSMKIIDEKLCTNTAYSWWEGRKSGIQLPTQFYYFKLKKILSLDDRFDDLIKREEAEREVVGAKTSGIGKAFNNDQWRSESETVDITIAATDAAKALDGSYGGFQPKPAVEVIIVAMKPLSEKTYVDQALKNGKGITWLDDCRIPGAKEWGIGHNNFAQQHTERNDDYKEMSLNRDSKINEGRFPANLLVSDDVLNNHSRFFSLDTWAGTLPFLVVPKASKSEKNKGLDSMNEETVSDGPAVTADNAFQRGKTLRKNTHPTVKPLKLMSYLITLGSRSGDTILDPFAGSGTTCLAAKELGRNYIGIEREKEYVEICEARLATVQPTLL